MGKELLRHPVSQASRFTKGLKQLREPTSSSRQHSIFLVTTEGRQLYLKRTGRSKYRSFEAWALRASGKSRFPVHEGPEATPGTRVGVARATQVRKSRFETREQNSSRTHLTISFSDLRSNHFELRYTFSARTPTSALFILHQAIHYAPSVLPLLVQQTLHKSGCRFRTTHPLFFYLIPVRSSEQTDRHAPTPIPVPESIQVPLATSSVKQQRPFW